MLIHQFADEMPLAHVLTKMVCQSVTAMRLWPTQLRRDNSDASARTSCRQRFAARGRERRHRA